MHSEMFSYFEEPSITPGFTLDNPLLLKATVRGGSFWARRGAMVAYQGEASFDYQTSLAGTSRIGHRVRRAAKRAVTGEGFPLMLVSGEAEVYLAWDALQIWLIELDGTESVTVNGANVLAFESTIDYEIKMMADSLGEAAGVGWHYTTMHGTGRVAVLSRGVPILFDVGRLPTYVDPHAAICWSSSTYVRLHVNRSLASMIGRRAEMFQIGFEGDGFVAVQPTEQAAKTRVTRWGDDKRGNGTGRGGPESSGGHDVLFGGTDDSFLTGYN